MGKKITQYTAVTSTNPDTGSLIDISEKSGSTYVTKKWSLLQLKTWLTAYLTIPFSSLTGTPTTLSGYGITDGVDTTGGTANYLAKFTDANTIEESLIRDDGTTIGVNTAPDGVIQLNVLTTKDYGVLGKTTKTTGYPIGVVGNAYGVGASENVGTAGTAQAGLINYGLKGNASGVANKNIGLYCDATGATANYGARIGDGTQGLGKILKSATADGETNWTYFPCEVQLAVSDETTALTTGTGKITFRMPYAMVVQEVRASLVVAGTTSGLTTIDINEGGSSILSTKLTIDLTETTSTTATTPAVISDSSLADDAEITIDIDAISGGATEKGLKVLLKGYRLL